MDKINAFQSTFYIFMSGMKTFTAAVSLSSISENSRILDSSRLYCSFLDKYLKNLFIVNGELFSR